MEEPIKLQLCMVVAAAQSLSVLTISHFLKSVVELLLTSLDLRMHFGPTPSHGTLELRTPMWMEWLSHVEQRKSMFGHLLLQSRSQFLQEQDSHSVLVCTLTNSQSTQSIPSFVGQDYFCETGITGGYSEGVIYPDGDPLWDGEGCGSGSTCCELNGPPFFCKSLPEPTTDDIEVRICGEERALDNEDTPIELVEIFVR